MKVKICSSLIEPREIKVLSSKGDGSFYKVSTQTLFNDAVCECRGFEFRASCKHVNTVKAAMCRWLEPLTEENKDIEKCPKCGDRAQIYELRPEFDQEIS